MACSPGAAVSSPAQLQGNQGPRVLILKWFCQTLLCSKRRKSPELQANPSHPKALLSRPEAVSVPRALSGASGKRVRKVEAGVDLETVGKGLARRGAAWYTERRTRTRVACPGPTPLPLPLSSLSCRRFIVCSSFLRRGC